MHGFVTTALLAAASAVGAPNVVDLAGDHWTLQNLPLNISVPARLPSQAHLDLYANRVIGDPLYGLNDFSLRWVLWQNWTYVAPISGLRPDMNQTFLLFDGLDTFTTITLCGQLVAHTNNQFRQYWFDVSRILATCEEADPVLDLNFGSAPTITAGINAEPGRQQWPAPVEQVFEIPNRQWMRKEQSDFGWDWGPAFAPAGPWLPAYAVQLGHGDVHPRNTLVDVYRQGQRNNMIPDQRQPWVVNASIDFIGTLPAGAQLSYALTDPITNRLACSGTLENVTVGDGVITGSTVIHDGAVELWWPAGMGAQKLYDLSVGITRAEKTIASVTKRIGFRTIVLNELPVTPDEEALGIAPGNHWHFEINGHPFFAKGSNLIPPHPFWASQDNPARIQSLFTAAVQGNQNMLRVWASGAYQPDYVYDLADEMGILLWSEFEFGDALYPTDQEFLSNVYEEAVYQVRRINHHPSLAYWAGGNELENLELVIAKAVDADHYDRYVAEYEELFLSTLFPAVFENTRSISYAPSSTSNGFLSLNFTEAPYMQERYELKSPGEIYGETDYYNYNSTVAFDMNAYPVGRFSNEFGYHSMSSLQTWRDALPESQLSFNSSFIVARNRHPPPGSLNISATDLSLSGMAQMTMAVEQWYPTPNKTAPVGNFSAWCWTTQVFQADYYSSQVAFYRRGSGLPQRTLGTLYWQLEDLWQTISWAGIEYGGRWKVLHYRMKDAYQPVVVAPYMNDTLGTLSAWVTSDLWSKVNGTASLEWFTWSGDPVKQLPTLENRQFETGALNSTQIYSINSTQLLMGLDPAELVMRVRIKASGTLPNADKPSYFVHEKWHHAAPLSKAHIVDPGLVLTHDAASKTFLVEAVRGVSAWTWLDYPSGAVVRFSDNGFWLAKGQRKRVSYTVEKDDTWGHWVDGVTIQSIWNNTLAQ